MGADLIRLSVSLTEAHRALITLLAEIAVADYLREIEVASESTDEAAQQHERITR